MSRRARDSKFWPVMAKEIRGVAEKCETCQLQKPWNKKETLEEEGETAWGKIGVNLFEIKGSSYLVTAD